MINKLAKRIHKNAIKKGFYDSVPTNIAEKLALIHSEVSEALEADRKNHHFKQDIKKFTSFEVDRIYKEDFEFYVKNTFEDELADIVIRVMDLAVLLNIDLENHIIAKHNYNTLREYKHNKKY